MIGIWYFIFCVILSRQISFRILAHHLPIFQLFRMAGLVFMKTKPAMRNNWKIGRWWASILNEICLERITQKMKYQIPIIILVSALDLI